MDQNNKIKAVYQIIEGPKLTKPLWRRVGTAFVNQDQSLSITLEALPITGRLHVRDLERRDADAEGRGDESRRSSRPDKEVA